MRRKLATILFWIRHHSPFLKAAGITALFFAALYGYTASKELERMHNISTAQVSPASIKAPSELPSEATKSWVISTINSAIQAQPTPSPVVTTIVKNVPMPTAQQVLSPAAANVVTNYYSYPSTVINNYSSGGSGGVSTGTTISAGTSVDGDLSIAGLLTLNGGLDLTSGLINANGLSFSLPSVSDTLVGVTDTATLANKTISATTNTVTDLGVQNFASHALSQWTDDIGLVTHDVNGFITGNLLGNAATATTALASTTADTATLADSVVNGLYSTGSYANPSWLTSLDSSKLIGAITATALAPGTYAIDVAGNAATATTASTALLADTATVADSVVNGIYSTGSYANPAWLTSLNGSKLVGTVTANAIANGSYAIDVTGNAATATVADTATNALAVANGLYSTGSYSNPAWLTSLSFSKLSNLPSTLAGYGITDAEASLPLGSASQYLRGDKTLHALDTSVVAENGNLYLTTPRVQAIGDIRYPLLSGSYTDPSWLTSLNGSKLTGTITANAIAAGTYAIGITGNAATVTNGLYATGSYANPTWLASVDGAKLTGTVTANAIANGSYNIDVTGNAATATLASVATNALAVTNGLYSTGSYSDPSWLASVNGSKLTGTVTANAIAGGTYAIGISGNAATATLASTVSNGVYTTGSYTNPSWITSLSFAKLTNLPTTIAGYGITDAQSLLPSGTASQYLRGDKTVQTLDSSVVPENGNLYFTATRVQNVGDLRYPLLSGTYANPSWITSIDGAKLTGTVTATAIGAGTYAIGITGNAATATLASTVTNGLYSTGSYSNPTWLTSLDGSKLSGTVTANAIAAGNYAINVTGNAASATLATTASAVTNGIYTTGSYANPSWITSLNGSKLVGTVTANAITGGSYAIDVTGNAATATLAASATNALAVTNGVYTTGSYVDPSWLTSVNGNKLTGTITANALAVADYTVNNLTTANTVVTSGTLANTLLSGSCTANLNAAGLAAFQTSATITTSHIFYNATRNRHSRITSVSTCTDASSNQWRVLTLSDSITGDAAGDSYTIYSPTGSIGNSTSGFFNNFYAINLKGLVSTLTGGFDIAEQYQSIDDSIEPGDVVALDPANPGFVQKTSSAYDNGAIGVIATNPGLTLGGETVGVWKKVALAGHVPVKVSTENGPIAIGDTLTASSQPGIAMKADSSGTVIGKAMEAYSGDGISHIDVFINVSSFTPPHVSMNDILNSVDEHAVTVDDKVLFNGGLVTDSIGSSANLLTISSDTLFIGRPYFNTDTAGFAVVSAGTTAVSVAYESPYLETPIVNATVTELDNDPSVFLSTSIRYVVTHSDTNGFTIQLNMPAPQDLRFSWTAFMVKNAKTARSQSGEEGTPPSPSDSAEGTSQTPEVTVPEPSVETPEVSAPLIEEPVPDDTNETTN